MRRESEHQARHDAQCMLRRTTHPTIQPSMGRLPILQPHYTCTIPTVAALLVQRLLKHDAAGDVLPQTCSSIGGTGGTYNQPRRAALLVAGTRCLPERRDTEPCWLRKLCWCRMPARLPACRQAAVAHRGRCTAAGASRGGSPLCSQHPQTPGACLRAGQVKEAL